MISNVLSMAQSVIPPVCITYYKFMDREVNDVGVIVSGYDDGITIYANVHPVQRSVYQDYGLDFNKKYIKVFAQKNVIDLDRDVSADKIKYDGEMYQVHNKTDWKRYNGWNSFLAVRID